MSPAEPISPEQVEQLLLNARLRDDLEPFMDESVQWIDKTTVPTEVENEFLSAMLAWERAPIVPIAQWFTPELQLAPPDTLAPAELHYKLWETIHALAEKRIVLDFADHLSDRALYTLILRDILPVEEKRIEGGGHTLHWDCAATDDDSDVWLRYYATDRDRSDWLKDHGGPIPPHEDPPYPRRMPQ